MSKNMILSCPPINTDRISLVKESITKWLTRQSLDSLSKSFGGIVPWGLSMDDLARWYLEFSDCWDYRQRQKQAYDDKVGEGARWLLNSDSLSELQKEATLKAAFELGLIGNSEPDGNCYDYIWVLGGAKLSCLLRTRLARNLIRDENLVCKSIVLLASLRPIGDEEREATNTYAPSAETEFDLFVASAHKEFGISDDFAEERYDDDINPNNSWIIRKYPTTNCEVLIIASPSSEPNKRRANSADTYEFFMKTFKVPEAASILLTTSQIYVPYQHLEAVRTIAIPYNVSIDTIGFPAEWGGATQGMNEPSNYLQEIRSTIQSIGRFMNEY